MKHVSVFAALTLALVLVGCGGSGGGDGQPINNPSLNGVIRVEAVSTKDPSIVQDPTNFQINENYVFELVQYNDAGKRTVISPSAVVWSSSDTNGVYGILGPNTGNFETLDRETQNAIVVEARYGGKIYKATYIVKPRQTRLSGRVVSSADSKVGVDGVTINFYTPVSNEEADIVMSGKQFQPLISQVFVGQTVKWTNKDTAIHNVTSDDLAVKSLNSGPLQFDETFSWQVPLTARVDNHEAYFYHSSVKDFQGKPDGTAGDGTQIGNGMAGKLQVVHNTTVMVKVGSVTTAYDGTFRASVPASTTAFQIDSSTIPLTFYHSVSTAGPDGKAALQFDTETEDCMPPVPSNLPQVGFKSFALPILLTPKSSGNPPQTSTPCYY